MTTKLNKLFLNENIIFLKMKRDFERRRSTNRGEKARYPLLGMQSQQVGP